MTGPDPKADLHRYLQAVREDLLWKLNGLSEYSPNKTTKMTADQTTSHLPVAEANASSAR